MGLLAEVSGSRFTVASVTYGLGILLFFSCYQAVLHFQRSYLWLGIGFSITALGLALSIVSRRSVELRDPQSGAKGRQFLPHLVFPWFLVVAAYPELASAGAWLAVLIVCTLLLLDTRAANILVLLALAAILLRGIWASGTMLTAMDLIPLLLVLHAGNLISKHIEFLGDKLAQLMNLDVDTGCGNSLGLRDEMACALEFKQRHSIDTALVVLEIKDYSQYLADSGAQKTIALLQDTVAVLKSRLRRTDSLFRYSEQVFVCVLPSTTESNALAVAEDLVRACSAYDYTSGKGFTLSSRLVCCHASMTTDQLESQIGGTTN